MPAALRVAEAIAGNDRAAVGALLASYRRIENEMVGRADAIEAATANVWLERTFDPAAVEARRSGLLARSWESEGTHR
jgi:enoyl-CoA hydratase